MCRDIIFSFAFAMEITINIICEDIPYQQKEFVVEYAKIKATKLESFLVKREENKYTLGVKKGEFGFVCTLFEGEYLGHYKTTNLHLVPIAIKYGMPTYLKYILNEYINYAKEEVLKFVSDFLECEYSG